MQTKKETRNLTIISNAQCSGNFNSKFIYDPKNKTIYTIDFKEKSIKNKLDQLLTHWDGTQNKEFEILRKSIPLFNTIWKDLEKTLKPKFKKGDFVVFKQERTDRTCFSLNSPIWIVGDIVGWQKKCNMDGKTVYQCKRKFKCTDSTETITNTENNAVPVETIDKLTIANKVMLKFKKELKTAGIKNAAITYMGKTYKI